MCLNIFGLVSNQMRLCPNVNFQYLNKLLGTGPPVYWITNGYVDFSNQTIRNKVCSGVGCAEDSIITKLYLAAQSENV